MRISISMSRDNEKWSLYLSDEKSSPFRIIITQNDLQYLMSEKLFSLLSNYDYDHLIQRLTPNQLIVLLYFFLYPQNPSFLIMHQWFSDIDCDLFLSEYLSNLVYNSRNDESHNPQVFFEAHSDEILPENISTFDSYNLNQKIVWNFNLVREPQEEESAHANLVLIRESYFLIEDHSCIITGFSINYTSFLEIISGYQSEIFHSLCKLVPLQDRDIKTLGQVFIENREISEMFNEIFSGEVECYGMNRSGKLIKYTNKQFSHGKTNLNDMLIDITRDVSNIPLFIKFVK